MCGLFKIVWWSRTRRWCFASFQSVTSDVKGVVIGKILKSEDPPVLVALYLCGVLQFKQVGHWVSTFTWVSVHGPSEPSSVCCRLQFTRLPFQWTQLFSAYCALERWYVQFEWWPWPVSWFCRFSLMRWSLWDLCLAELSGWAVGQMASLQLLVKCLASSREALQQSCFLSPPALWTFGLLRKQTMFFCFFLHIYLHNLKCQCPISKKLAVWLRTCC